MKNEGMKKEGMNRSARFLLFPLAVLFGLGVSARKFFFASKILRASKFSIPVINVGNLSVGGTGKSPHVEYLIRLLSPYLEVVCLSRGYGRKTNGFRFVNLSDIPDNVGDEPLQFKLNFPDIAVAVGEKRALAIPYILQNQPQTKTIILDDAFQHLAVTPYLNILLTTFENPYSSDYLLPVGSLREPRSAAKRAEIIVVTKSPSQLTELERANFEKKLGVESYQHLFFSSISYGALYALNNRSEILYLSKDMEVVLISGIANAEPLEQYLNQNSQKTLSLNFEDHHAFVEEDVSQVISVYKNLKSDKKIIITTEKDATRLRKFSNQFIENNVPVFIQPIQIVFHKNEEPYFDDCIKNYLLDFKN